MVVRRRLLKTRKGGGSKKPGKSDTSISIERSHARQIRDLPARQRSLVIQFIREGIPTGKIATYFKREGMISVQEKTFAQYITAFKRVYPELLDLDEDARHLDSLVRASGPALEEEDLLEQMIRLQKHRIGIAHRFEKDTNMLNPILHKEVDITIGAIEKLAKIRGKTAAAGRPEKDKVAMPTEAREELSKMDRSEAAQDRLVGLFGRLASQVKEREERGEKTATEG